MLRPLWRSRLARAPNVRLPVPIAEFRAEGTLGQLSAKNRHKWQLFDDLLGAQQDRRGYGKAERIGGIEVHGHLELGRQLHREIARLRAARDAIDISDGTTPDVYPVDAVGPAGSRARAACGQAADFGFVPSASVLPPNNRLAR